MALRLNFAPARPICFRVRGLFTCRLGEERTRAEALVISGVSSTMPLPTRWLTCASAALLSASLLVSAAPFADPFAHALAAGKATRAKGSTAGKKSAPAEA